MVIKANDFPKDFFGVATSSYQIEGAYRDDGRGMSIWDDFAVKGRILGGDTGDVACDHYHRLEDDLNLIASLGFKSYRFSVSWPRVLPEGRGNVNEKGLDFYERLVDGLLARGIVPNLTLYHWDLPSALQRNGGWENRDTAYAFGEYTDIVSRRLGERVSFYTTLNEPFCSSYVSYLFGEHAPGIKNGYNVLFHVVHHLLLAHGIGIETLRKNVPGSQCGIVLNMAPFYPNSEKKEDQKAAQRSFCFFNDVFAMPVFRGYYPKEVMDAFSGEFPDVSVEDMALISQPLDFWGLNYYSSHWIANDSGADRYPFSRVVPQGLPTTEMDWEIYPEGLTDLLLLLYGRYQLPPCYITENGMASSDRVTEQGTVHDTGRVFYIMQHLQAVARALEKGIPLKGYYAWSLMDNFEWAWGYGRRFGLVHVDYKTQKRTIKESGYFLKRLMKRA